jgi:hypothetical protein
MIVQRFKRSKVQRQRTAQEVKAEHGFLETGFDGFLSDLEP